eukprot:749355-Hanusia_phi.AAC.1
MEENGMDMPPPKGDQPPPQLASGSCTDALRQLTRTRTRRKRRSPRRRRRRLQRNNLAGETGAAQASFPLSFLLDSWKPCSTACTLSLTPCRR